MLKKLNICHISTVHSGTDIRIFHKECVSLAANGHRVTYIHPGTGSETLKGVLLIGTGIYNYKNKFIRMTKGALETVNLALSLNPDVIHIHDGELVRYIKKIKRMGIRVVYDAHENLPMQILEKEWLKPFIRPMLSRLSDIIEKYYSKYADLVLVVADKTCERFEKLSIRTVQLKNYPIITEFEDINIDYGVKKEAKTVCYSGAVWSERGLDTMCDAMSGLKDIRFIIAGRIDHPKKKWFISNLSKNIEYKGYLSRTDVLKLYEQSIAGLCLFKPYPNNMIDPPTKIFEYMAAGIPVIASDFESMSGIVEKYNCGICVNPLDISQIRKAVEFILDNPDRAEEMGQNGRNAVAEYLNWEKHSEVLIYEYNRLAGEIYGL